MNSLKQVVVVRPGDDEERGVDLTPIGRAKAEELAKLIPDKIGKEKKVLLVTPSDKRSLQTAYIIGKGLGVEPRSLSTLENRFYENGESQMKQILQFTGGYDAVVVVAHYTAPSGIMNAFRQRFIGLSNKVSRERTPRGTALYQSLEHGSGEVTRLPELTPDPID